MDLAVTLRSVGASRLVRMGALGSELLNFHGAGVIPAVRLSAFAPALIGADQKGLIVGADAGSRTDL